MDTKEIKKRGRPPLGDRPLTLAEKQARYRARVRRAGERRVFEMVLEGDMRRRVEEVATILDIPAARALRLCAECGLSDMEFTARQVRELMQHDPAERRVRQTLSSLKKMLEAGGVSTVDIDRAMVGLGAVERIEGDALAALANLVLPDAEMNEALQAMIADAKGEGGAAAD